MQTSQPVQFCAPTILEFRRARFRHDASRPSAQQRKGTKAEGCAENRTSDNITEEMHTE